MILKIILFIFVYLICGVVVSEVVLWHDRNADWGDEWLMDGDYDEQVLVVLLFPFFLIRLIFWGLKNLLILFIKAIRTVYTAIAYTMVAYIRNKQDGK